LPKTEITELGTGNTTLCVFRTNDFRIGFLTENAGEMIYVLSKRTYAGQAMPPEYAKARVQDAKLWIVELQWHYSFTAEYANAIPDNIYLACYNTDTSELEVIEQERIGLREIVLTFNRPVGGVEGAFENYLTTYPVRAIEACIWQNGNQLKIYLAQDLGQSVDFTITVGECHEAWQVINGHKMALETMEIVLEGEPIQTIHRESAAVEITSEIYIDNKVEHSAFLNESVTVTVECTVELSPAGVIPI
jgi:hypothetical protein